MRSRDETALGEPAHPVAEVAGREGVRSDETDGLALREHVGADRGEDEVAERSLRLPPVDAVARRLDRRRGRVEGLRLEPLDPRVPVAELPAPLRVVEVVEEELDVAACEAERGEPRAGLVRPHGA